MILLLNKSCAGAGTSVQAEILAQSCRLLAVRKFQLFGILMLSYIHMTIHMLLVSVGNPGVSEARNMLIFICCVY